LCRRRELMRGENNVGGSSPGPSSHREGALQADANRKDLTCGRRRNVVERAHNSGRESSARKIATSSIARHRHRDRTESNSDGMRKTIDLIRESDADFIFTNLVDFDSNTASQRRPGYAKALETFDSELAASRLMRDDDLLYHRDHGSTDRCLTITARVRPHADRRSEIRPRVRSYRSTFADLGVTICDYSHRQQRLSGKSGSEAGVTNEA